MTQKKMITITVLFAVTVITLIVLGVLSVIKENFICETILHVMLNILKIPLILYIIKKCLSKELPQSMNKVLLLCGCILLLHTALNGVRYILSGGKITLLFLPLYLPLICIIAVYYVGKDLHLEKSKVNKLILFAGVPLTLLAAYFEVLSITSLL